MAAKKYISDMLLLYARFSEKLPHVLMSQPHFETCEQNSPFYNQPSTVFSAYHGKFSYLFCYPYN